MKNFNAGCSTTLAKNDSTPLKAMLNKGCTLLFIAVAIIVTSCVNRDPDDQDLTRKIGSVYVLNEGSYMASNATLTVYDPTTKAVEADIFTKANAGASLGDTPTSMKMINEKAFITVTGSGKIYIIDPETGKLTGKITDLNSPRHIEVIAADKAYVSNLWNDVIDIINPKTEQKTGEVSLGKGNYAERFVRIGNFIYTNVWSYGNEILKIDPLTDKVVDRLEVGVQPTTLFKDKYGKLWTLTDGGYQGHPIFELEDPTIVCVDPVKFTVEKRIKITRGKAIMYSMAMDEKGENIYFVNLDLYKMSVDANQLPSEPFISYKETTPKLAVHNFYSIGVSPDNGDIYLGDAIDFMQSGDVLRYNSKGEKLDSFKAGIIPGAFGFVPSK